MGANWFFHKKRGVSFHQTACLCVSDKDCLAFAISHLHAEQCQIVPWNQNQITGPGML